MNKSSNDDNIPVLAEISVPASFHWLAAALSIDPPLHERLPQTLGYWKNHPTMINNESGV